jgi:hypothetical protein
MNQFAGSKISAIFVLTYEANESGGSGSTLARAEDEAV